VLETLAAVQMDEPAQTEMLPNAVVYLTSQTKQLEALPAGNRWILWTHDRFTPPAQSLGIVIDRDLPLQQQLNQASFAKESTPDRYVRSSPTQNSELN
jgi:hypothetical protein